MPWSHKRSLIIASAILLNSSLMALACEQIIELDRDQVRHSIELLKSADADELDQIDVLGTLMCAERASVRDLAARTALASPNKSVQAGILSEMLLQKKNFLIVFVEQEGISNDVRDFIREKIAVSYQAQFVDRNTYCVGLESRSCQDFFLEITGKNVEIKFGDDLGSFSLDENGELHGFYKPSGISAKIPAKINLL